MTDKITIQGEGSEIALLERIITLQRRVEELERVIRMVECAANEDGEPYCLWCLELLDYDDHAPDCPRQAALNKE